MNIGRMALIALAVFFGSLHILNTVHHAVKIRLGDTQEGWSLSFVGWMVITPIMIAFLIELARKIKD